MSTHKTQQQVEQRFLYRAEQERSKILFRMATHAQVLRGATALFAASNEVSRAEWRDYVTKLQLDKTLPGIQGTGFTRMIDRRDKAAHERAIRAEGFADYAITPPGERAQYSSIVYHRTVHRAQPEGLRLRHVCRAGTRPGHGTRARQRRARPDPGASPWSRKTSRTPSRAS